MSYQSPPPPPPTKSSYGDTELTDDGWSQQSGPPKFTNYPQGNMGGQPMQPQFNNQGIGNRYAPGNIQNIGQGQAPQMPDLKGLAQTMTQDDILFMRRVRRDCFFYRVMPLSSIACGCLYMYNKSRQLPNTFGRFVGVSIISSLVGISSFRGKFYQLVKESKSNSAYMQALRRSMGAAAIVPDDGFSGDSQSVEYGSNVSDGSSNWGATELASSDSRFDRKPGFSTPGQFYNDSSYQPLDPGNQEAPKPAATYEELRSRNRGYSR